MLFSNTVHDHVTGMAPCKSWLIRFNYKKVGTVLMGGGYRHSNLNPSGNFHQQGSAYQRLYVHSKESNQWETSVQIYNSTWEAFHSIYYYWPRSLCAFDHQNIRMCLTSRILIRTSKLNKCLVSSDRQIDRNFLTMTSSKIRKPVIYFENTTTHYTFPFEKRRFDKGNTETQQGKPQILELCLSHMGLKF